MPDEPYANWEERVRKIASALLTLEVNTVIKNGMVGQKMPEVPIALHEIVQQYNGYLEDHGGGVTRRLLVAACGRLADSDHSQHYWEYLRDWAGQLEKPNWPFTSEPEPTDDKIQLLTNGAEAFEALTWAATAVRQWIALGEGQAPKPEVRLQNQGIAAILTRIAENSRQLREVAIVLEKAFSSTIDAAAAPSEKDAQESVDAHNLRVKSLQQLTLPYRARLNAIRQDPAASEAQQSNRLFGGTVDQTTQALFRHPRPVLNIDPDLTVLIRKAWDIALEEVRFQTVIQIDGDVLVRVAEMPEDDRNFLAGLHRTAVNDGVAQWHSFFQIVGDLVSTIGTWLFGGGGKSKPQVIPPTP